MFNSTAILLDSFVTGLHDAYQETFGYLKPDYGSVLGWAGRMALENISNSDALYHNVDHTVLVTMVGIEILKGKHLRRGGVTPQDWLHCVLALLCHDIGFVRGICQDDQTDSWTTGVGGARALLPVGATDAAMNPYHVDRGKMFVRERFGAHPFIDCEIVVELIECTRFPISEDFHPSEYGALVRAGDLIGQLADPRRRYKYPALFHEFEECGINQQLGYRTPADLIKSYPTFFWRQVKRYIEEGLQYLKVTQVGQQWIDSLYAHIFEIEHQDILERGMP